MVGDASDPVAALVRLHVLSYVSSYRGNLSGAIRAIRNGWLPAEDDERLLVLARYLVEAGYSEVDGFLLRVGLTVPGSFRGIKPPLLVLEETRGGLSRRRLEEAAGQIGRLTEVLALGREFLPEIDGNCQRAVEDLLSLVTEGPAPVPEPSWVELYQALSASEARQLAELAVGKLDTRLSVVRKVLGDLLQRLACFRIPPLDRAVCEQLAARQIFWPASIYRDAGDDVAARLISALDRPSDRESANQLLLTLAWTRSSRAERAIVSWRRSPPGWAARLRAPPDDYLEYAGWSLDLADRRRDVISTVCFRLLPASEAGPGSVVCFAPQEELCPTCGAPVCRLFDFSGIDLSRLGAEWAAAPRRLPTCLLCSYHAPVFSSYGGDSESLLKPESGCENQGGFWQPTASYRQVSAEPFPPFAAAEPFSLADASTLGGTAMWLQSADYPHCPRCRRTLRFLAQVENHSIGLEGLRYAFFCGQCRLSATTCQQT